MTRPRTTLQTHIEFLRLVNSGKTKPTVIMYAAHTSWKPSRRVFHSLVSQGLLEVKPHEKTMEYCITKKGVEVLCIYEDLISKIKIKY